MFKRTKIKYSFVTNILLKNGQIICGDKYGKQAKIRQNGQTENHK